jgi:hypothetical protein
MSAEVSAEVVAEADSTPLDRIVAAMVVDEQVDAVLSEEPVDPMMVKIRADRKLGEVVRAYVEAAERFDKAGKDFSASCQAIRELIKPNTTVVVAGGYGKHYGKNFLLTNDGKSFEVKPVEII